MFGILVAILGLAVLMIVHEAGHLLVARAFGLRVLRFSIGFGPPLWRYQPAGSDTLYQVALIPFLAYVQIAGMNPFEEADSNDRGSYANASLTARFLTVAAGPLANYAFASVLFMIAFLAFGSPILSTQAVVSVMPGGAAAAGGLQESDKVERIDGVVVRDFEHLREIVVKHPNQPLRVDILRGDLRTQIEITPEPKAEGGGGLIGVRPTRTYTPMSLEMAAVESLERPALVVRDLVVGLVQLVLGREKPEVAGPVRIVKYGALMVESGAYDVLYFLARLSAYLGGFNLLAFPALDGGRLMFLVYEVVARRRPDARVEAHVHAFGLLVFLALIAVVTVQDLQR